MAAIHILDKAVAELIAAGEVVERPASIAKELIENAIDAGADDVTVEIRAGGIGYLRVTDNGGGIARGDVPKAFLRHATSKIREADDLDSILTLGFRGEALASIAAMCRVELVTRTAEDSEGTLYRIEGGQFVETAPAGCPAGTTIIVRDVFFNTPARMKFLKKDVSEGNAVSLTVDRCALSRPDVAFRLIRDGKTVLQTSGNGDLRAALLAVYGREFAASLIPVDYRYDGAIRVTGMVTQPGGSRPTRSYQNFFLNGRFIRSRTLSAALEEAFKNRMMTGRFPGCALNLEIGAQMVDVNVHPAKTEVRFADEKPAFSAVYYAVKSALAAIGTPLAGDAQPEKPKTVNELTLHLPQQTYKQERLTAQEFRGLFPGKPGGESFSKPLKLASPKTSPDIFVDDPVPKFEKNRQPPFSDKISGTQPVTIFTEDAAKSEILPTDTTGDKLSREESPQPQAYRLIGELLGTYILLEQEDGLLLVDKHAAHERILYERLRENLSHEHRQVLLSPLSVSLSKEEYGALLENPDALLELGFLVEDFGGGTVLVRETPLELSEQDAAAVIGEVAQRILRGNRDLTPPALDRLYYSIACKSAVRAGDTNSLPELAEIVRRLEQNPEITHCPHGRPVFVKLGRVQIEKMFGRLG